MILAFPRSTITVEGKLSVCLTRCYVLQVSDQLVEINGDSTVGMTHSQAVEQIRRGGHRIHLVLKKGNGYVPDYGKHL